MEWPNTQYQRSARNCWACVTYHAIYDDLRMLPEITPDGR